MLFNHLFVGCLKGILQGKAKPTAKVAHVHHLFLQESLLDFRIDAQTDFSAVSYGSFPSFCGRRDTEEKDFHRPRVLIRVLVVQENTLISRIVGRGIDVWSNLMAR